jgi:formate dehydrogenase major subunit
MSEIKIQLNGKEVICDSSQTILQAAEQQGFAIPNMCHDKKLEPFGSCWVCLVEVKGARGFVPSCATKVYDGMVVETDSQKVKAARQLALELLLSNHYGDCIAPCQATCPAGCDVQGYTALLANGMEAEALRLIKETLPLPASLGRVCPHPCETECRRNLVEEPVSICYLKRRAADFDLDSAKPYMPKVEPETGKKVAVIGAGPAGLTAAYYLRQKGHQVTILEALPKPGGWLRYGIPEYRLPKEVLDREIKTITDLGIEIKCDQVLGRDFTVEDLRKSYQAVFLGFGAHASTKMGVEGEEGQGVWDGIGFLKKLALGEKVQIGRTVAVIGGGNTAIDAARTSLRLGAEEVTIVYRRSEKEMPANPFEIEEAKHEGVKFKFLTAPTRVIACTHTEGGGLVCQKMELGEPDASGRRRPMPVAGSDYKVEADTVIAAIGQSPDLSILGQNHGLETTKWSTIKTDQDTGATNLPGVFAAGDLVTGAATVVEAIGGGHRAAEAIHAYLSTGKTVKSAKNFNITKGKINEVPRELFAHIPRAAKAKMPMLAIAERKNFTEVEKGFAPKTAQAEAERCLECGCADVVECKLRDYATEYQVAVKRFLGEVKKHPIDDSHPFLQRDQSKCILCGRCVRMCLETVGASALGFVYRGFNTVVAPSMEKPFPESSCVSCGACIETCPVGALTERPRHLKPAPWEMPKTPSVCTFCGVGCGLEIHAKGNRVVKMTGNQDSPVSQGSLCFKGKFAFELMHHPGRLIEPLAKQGKKLSAMEWKAALNKVNNDIDSIVKKHGPEAVALSASGRTSLEEAEGIRSWAAKKGITKFSSLAYARDGRSLLALEKVLGQSKGKGFDELDKAGAVLLVGSDPYQQHPVFDRLLRKAARKGVPVYCLSSKMPLATDYFSAQYTVKSGGMAWALNGMLKTMVADGQPSTAGGFGPLKKALSGLSLEAVQRNSGLNKARLKEVADIFGSRQNLLVCFYADNADAETAKAIANILLFNNLPENFIALRAKANSTGLDRFITAEAAEILKDAEKGKLKALVLLNEDPLGSLPDGKKMAKAFSKLERLVVADAFLTETAKAADIVLPTCAFAEQDGSFINSEGRLQHFKQSVQPACGMTSKQMLSELGGVPLPGLPAEKKNGRQFMAPQLKKGKEIASGFAGDVLEKMAWELKKKEGILKE